MTIQTEKDRITDIVKQQPDDASFDEIMRELAFERMIARGLADVRAGRRIGHEELKARFAAEE